MSEHIQNIVGRCYNITGQDLGLTPNALDQQNPPTINSTSSVGPVATQQTPSEVIAGLIGRCYGSPVIGTLSNAPNPLDGDNPTPKFVASETQPLPSPTEIIQGLIGRCYPGLPTLTPPKEVPQLADDSLTIDLPYLDFVNSIFDTGLKSPLIIKVPNPNDPSQFAGYAGDCDRVLRLKLRGEVDRLGGGYWRVKSTGEKLFCQERTPDFDWETCVRNALECTFRPYIGGTWRPPKSDCNTYYPNGWSANKDRVCIDNCYPDRWPVYESTNGTEYNYTTDTLIPPGYTLTSQSPAFWILQEEIEGHTVPLFKYRGNGGDYFLTTNPGQPDGPGQGERASMNAAGMIFQNIIGHVFQSKDKSVTYLGKDEQIQELHRFYRASPVDHKYTIDAEIPGEPPRPLSKKSAYRIPQDVKYDLTITMDVEKGSAGYNNALGVYLADNNGPQTGLVIVKSAKSGENISVVTVPVSTLQQYKGGTLGFFLIPNGGNANSLSTGQVINFVPHNGDGFRGSGISTAQGNYCLFSDRLWNKHKKDQTKWKGNKRQMWEDLINGDDDYDDLKLWHKLEWTTNGYLYEGVQCYVYETDAPPKVYAPPYRPNNCDARLLKDSFRDVVVTRQDCGILSPTIESADVDIECGICTGAYSSKLETSQTIQAATGGKFRIKSYGGITGGVRGDCIKFTIAFKKNGITIFQEQYEARYWPAIGKDLYASEITLTSSDSLTFEFISLDSGPTNGLVQPSIGLFDVSQGVFASVFTLMLNTNNSDDVDGMVMGPLSTNEIPILDGNVTGLAFQFSPTAADEGIWSAGSKSTESWSIDPDDGRYPYTIVLANNAIQPMSSIKASNPGIWGNGNRLGSLLPDITGGYIDTGLPYYPSDRYLNGYNQVTLRRNAGIYSSLLQDHLVTKWKRGTGSFSTTDRNALNRISPTLFAKKKTPWYDVIDSFDVASRLWDGSSNNRDTYYSPHTFIHDYYLDPGNQNAGAGAVNLAKIRVGFTFYAGEGFEASQGTNHWNRNWYCVIHLIEVLSQGFGYASNQEFKLYWPPIRNDKNEFIGQTPYFPDQDPEFDMPKKLTAYWENYNIVKRAAKEAVYQESHNNQSPIWYTSSTKNKFRVQFKVIITETT